jgi:hypothetical protein
VSELTVHIWSIIVARACAFCGSPGRLTREHIWPKGIIDRVDYGLRFTGQGKVISGEPTIADVCAACNNGPLSALDAYICQLYDQYFHEFHDKGSSVVFQYDWSRLGNWFLKASFNAARASRNATDIAILSRCTAFIRGIDRRQPDLAIWADLTEPSYMAKQLESGVYTTPKMRPQMTRLATINIPDVTLGHYTLRMVAINSFYFYLAIPVKPYMHPRMDELKRVCEFFALMTAIDPEKDTAIIKTTGLAFHNIVAPHFAQNEDAYRAHMESRGA